MSLAIRLAESKFAPIWLIRCGIRSLIRQRLRDEKRKNTRTPGGPLQSFTDFLRQCPIAVDTNAANEQHYEVPPDFFLYVLGKRLKYSCCYYTSNDENLDRAEENMLALTCERAEVQDGMDLLELGCGWGSLTLWMAEHYPKCRITAVSNSHQQREFILERCREQGFENVRVITSDINDFETAQQFDCILSIEMFEHMRNYNLLLEKVASWMKPEARLFVHVFCHREYAYAFQTEGTNNWMGRHFFTGGIMPSYDLLLNFQDRVVIEKRWQINGNHYRKTAEHWIDNMNRNRSMIMPVLIQTYGRKYAALWFRRWRIFFMACSELWGFHDGEEWMVAHYVFRKNRPVK